MRLARQLGGLAVLLLVTPASAADLPIPPPLPTRASLPFERAAPIPRATPLPPAAAPAEVVVPRIPSQDVVRENPLPPVPTPPSPPVIESSPQESTPPTWLERFGPFLRSQLDMIFTGSVTPHVPYCGQGKRAVKRGSRMVCERLRARPHKASAIPNEQTGQRAENVAKPRTAHRHQVANSTTTDAASTAMTPPMVP